MPGAQRPASRQADFTWAEAHGQAVVERQRVCCAPCTASGRRPPSRVQKRAPVAESGSVTRFIGPPPQRGVAGHHREDRVARQQAAEQAGGGAGIAHVEHVGRLDQAADAAAGDAPGARPPSCVDLGAQRAHGGGGAQHVLAFQQAGDLGGADGQRAEHQGAVADRLVARARAKRPESGAGGRAARSGRGGVGSWAMAAAFDMAARPVAMRAARFPPPAAAATPALRGAGQTIRGIPPWQSPNWASSASASPAARSSTTWPARPRSARNAAPSSRPSSRGCAAPGASAAVDEKLKKRAVVAEVEGEEVEVEDVEADEAIEDAEELEDEAETIGEDIEVETDREEET